jgi:hypothetical protein
MSASAGAETAHLNQKEKYGGVTKYWISKYQKKFSSFDL